MKKASPFGAVFSLAFWLFLSFTAVCGAGEREFALVLEVVDGDTLRVDVGGARKSVRLIGIDCPEFRMNEKASRDAALLGRDVVTLLEQGGRARAFVLGLVSSGSVVYLEGDIRKTDRYGRRLAYVYLSDGRMLNEEIVRAGFAGLMIIGPDTKYAKRLRFAYAMARKEKNGLWAGVAEGGAAPFPDGDRRYAVTPARR